jgi:hypothetical protein
VQCTGMNDANEMYQVNVSGVFFVSICVVEAKGKKQALRAGNGRQRRISLAT